MSIPSDQIETIRRNGRARRGEALIKSSASVRGARLSVFLGAVKIMARRRFLFDVASLPPFLLSSVHPLYDLLQSARPSSVQRRGVCLLGNAGECVGAAK